MAGETSWITHCFEETQSLAPRFESFADQDQENGENEGVAMECVLPDELVERILAYLPVASVFRAGSVCKRWNEIVTEKRFLWNADSDLSLQKPWYFMFTSSDEPVGFAYDHVLRKWYGIDLPCIESSNWCVSTSYGLVCFMDNGNGSRLYVGNPITKQFKTLDEPPNPKFPDYSALAVSVDRKSHSYTVSVVKSKQVPDNFFQWDLSVHVYDSETTLWMTSYTEVLSGWRAGDESVICDGVLYFLVYSTGGGATWTENRHRVIPYSLANRHRDSLMSGSIAVPCSLTCGRLMNLNDKLVMVGGIGKYDRSDIIKGIGIWTLDGKDWVEVSRMPHKFFQGFGELDDVFASSGTDDVVYIQSYGAPALLMFDMTQRVWKWSHKCPVAKKFPLQLFTGFCFEPRLEVPP